MNHAFRGLTFLFVLLLASGLGLSATGGSDRLPADDLAAVRAVNNAYVDAWLSNDPEQVMKVFAPDAIIVPQGETPVQGLESIRKFFWPEEAPKTKIVQFTITTDELGGSNDVAYVRGTYSFSFQFLRKGVMTPRPNEGNYLMLFRRQPDGRWLVSHRMWAQKQ